MTQLDFEIMKEEIKQSVIAELLPKLRAEIEESIKSSKNKND